MSKTNNVIYVSVVVLLVAIVASTAFLTPQISVNQNSYTQTIEKARIAIWQDISTGRASSASIAIMDNGRIVYSEAFAMANRQESIPATTQTLYSMGSISKTFCATAIMLLVDDGKINLDGNVTQYLPEFKMADSRYTDITVRMLLDHTSGLPGTDSANNFGYETNPAVYQDLITSLSNATLKAAPGEMAPYTNDGFTLAEMIVARVSGQSYIDFLSSRIFTPLNLQSIGLSVGERSNQTIALCYRHDNGINFPVETVSLLGAGGLSTTATDLAKFGDSFCAGGKHILTQSSIDEMIKPQLSIFATHAIAQKGINPEFSYGLGLDVTDLPYYMQQGLQIFGKGGDTADYHSMLLCDPQHRITVAVMEAGHGAQAADIAFDILNNVLTQKGLLTQAASPAIVPEIIPAEYNEFAGYYAPAYIISFDSATNICTVTTKNNAGTSSATHLFYSKGSFYTLDGSTRYSFLAVDGHRCLLLAHYNDDAYFVLGEQLPTLQNPQTLPSVDGAVWLRRNVAPYEAYGFNPPHVLLSSTTGSPRGYVFFSGYKEIKSATYAAMASGTVRDQTELNLLTKNGQIWAQLYDSIYAPSSAAVALQTGANTVTIESDGYNEWFHATQACTLSVQSPARVLVYSSTGSFIYDSVLMGDSAAVPQGGYVMLAGNPGDVLTVTAK